MTFNRNRSYSMSGKIPTVNLGNMETPAFIGNLPTNPGKLREKAPSENSSDLNLFGPLLPEIKNRTSETPSAKEIRQEQEDSMDEDQDMIDKSNLPEIGYETPEPRKKAPLKKLQINAPEGISIKLEALTAEGSPVIVASETLEEPCVI
ncbi:hypothetical protein H4Q26_010588 [Puccinia striiformis f. sp. tritici PST-130]|nr:hypothetical protein H4Q26_010588 [Puccinia striiformis f. sp. tritici PST-130]